MRPSAETAGPMRLCDSRASDLPAATEENTAARCGAERRSHGIMNPSIMIAALPKGRVH